MFLWELNRGLRHGLWELYRGLRHGLWELYRGLRHGLWELYRGLRHDSGIEVSVATQLSLGTLKAHVRSKGIQATVSFQSVGTETSTYPDFPLASTPIKGLGWGPRKRRRMELEEEQGETSTVFEETLDLSYHPGESVLAEESDV
ncbi:hypothetical protein F7725_018995, partial [Dissostichus mawsoni]